MICVDVLLPTVFHLIVVIAVVAAAAARANK